MDLRHISQIFTITSHIVTQFKFVNFSIFRAVLPPLIIAFIFPGSKTYLRTCSRTYCYIHNYCHIILRHALTLPLLGHRVCYYNHV